MKRTQVVADPIKASGVCSLPFDKSIFEQAGHTFKHIRTYRIREKAKVYALRLFLTYDKQEAAICIIPLDPDGTMRMAPAVSNRCRGFLFWKEDDASGLYFVDSDFHNTKAPPYQAFRTVASQFNQWASSAKVYSIELFKGLITGSS
jgi:hypothetical protein